MGDAKLLLSECLNRNALVQGMMRNNRKRKKAPRAAAKSSGSRFRTPPYGQVWSGIVKRKVGGADERVVAKAFARALLPFSQFRDVVDIDLLLLSEELSTEDLKVILDCFVSWLDEFEKAADDVFAQTPTEPAMEIYRGPLLMLRQILVHVRDGDKSIWTSGMRNRGERSDPAIVRAFKEQAARTYKLMRFVGATAQEAVDAINQAASRARRRGRNPIGALTQEAIRRRASQVEHFDDVWTNQILDACLPDSKTRDLRRVDLTVREMVLKRIAMYTLSGILASTWHLSRK